MGIEIQHPDLCHEESVGSSKSLRFVQKIINLHLCPHYARINWVVKTLRSFLSFLPLLSYRHELILSREIASFISTVLFPPLGHPKLIKILPSASEWITRQSSNSRISSLLMKIAISGEKSNNEFMNENSRKARRRRIFLRNWGWKSFGNRYFPV